MARALKVYRTAIGFHDAYVAAPTKKAALEAWGADRNLFTSGRAEIVTDTELTKAPLAAPGKVVKVLRGTAAEQFAALGETPAKPRKSAEPAPKPSPRPSRMQLEKGEQALAAAKAQHARALAVLARREDALRAERRALEREHNEEVEKLERARDAAHDAYDEAMRDWRG